MFLQLGDMFQGTIFHVHCNMVEQYKMLMQLLHIADMRHHWQLVSTCGFHKKLHHLSLTNRHLQQPFLHNGWNFPMCIGTYPIKNFRLDSPCPTSLLHSQYLYLLFMKKFRSKYFKNLFRHTLYRFTNRMIGNKFKAQQVCNSLRKLILVNLFLCFYFSQCGCIRPHCH